MYVFAWLWALTLAELAERHDKQLNSGLLACRYRPLLSVCLRFVPRLSWQIIGFHKKEMTGVLRNRCIFY
jgi:hypothetical protein